jgi:subtilisin family serine protease
MIVPPGLAGGSSDRADREVVPVFQGNWEGLLWTRYGVMDLDEVASRVPDLPTDTGSRYWIVQFDGPIPDGTADRLAYKGSHVVGYFPDFAYVVYSSAGHPDLGGIDHVRGAVPFYSGFKIDPSLLDEFRLEERRASVLGTDTLLVDSFLPDPSILMELAGLSSGAYPASGTRTVVRLPISDIDDLLSIDGIRSVEPYHPVELHNNVSTGFIGVPYVWSTMGLTGKGQMVGIADTGLDTGVDNASVTGDILADFDNRVTFANWAGTSPDDTYGHGTHVAGSVAGDGSLSSGKIKGMAPKAKIYFQGIADDSGYLTGLPTNLSQLFKQAYDGGARIHTNSWGSAVAGQYTSYSRDVDWFLYNYPDMIILFSAGNSGIDYYKPYPTYNPDGKIDDDSLGSPSTAKDCITVGAGENLRSTGGYQFQWATGSWAARYSMDPIKTDRISNNPMGMAAFSSRGPTDDGRIKPDVFAPGTNILSDRSTKTSSNGWGTFSGNSNYIFMGGTSMSTPITAGALALIREYYNQTLKIDRPSGALLKATLINGAQDQTPGQYGSSGTTREMLGRPDSSQGWGRINITNSIMPKGMHLSFLDHTTGIGAGQNVSTELSVGGGKYLNLTLAWSDYPGELYAAKELVNDLDLEVTAPNGTIYRGNDFSSPFNDAWDRKNPLEVIQLKNPATGTWKVRIIGYSVPRGPQHFALVATGAISNFTGVLTLDKAFYSTDVDRINIGLIDQDRIGKKTATVNVNSGSLPAGRAVTLSEIGVSGRFTGYVTTSNSSTADTAYLHVGNDETVRARYSDQSPSVNVDVTATAKRPQRVLLDWMPEYGLVHSEGEVLLIHGRGGTGIDTSWTLSGLPIGTRKLHDDGNSSQKDQVKDDGNYSALWNIPSGTDGTHVIRQIVNDPYLGIRVYNDYPIEFNSTMPRFPSGLTGIVLPEGNSVQLSWSASNETDLAFYTIMGKTIGGLMAMESRGWTTLLNTTGLAQGAAVTGLTDGVEYILTISVTDTLGVTSDTAVPIRAVPADSTAPLITLSTPAQTLVGQARLVFQGDADLRTVLVEYWNDTDSNGSPDDPFSTYVPIGIGPADAFLWDTRVESGGPGDVSHVLLRFRGYDEVPNESPYMIVGGFSVDNTGPRSVQIVPPSPPRVTNEPDQSLAGTSEPNGWVHIYLNDVWIDNASVDGSGAFIFDIVLIEGRNALNLSAYDENGAGPTNITYNITLDTTAPTAIIGNGSDLRIVEISHTAESFQSMSYDEGADPEFAIIGNITWILRSPEGMITVYFGNETQNLTLERFGNYTLTLRVRDPAGNQDLSTITINVSDNTAPIVNISGPFTLDEDDTGMYDATGTFDNDPIFRTRPLANFFWLFTGDDFDFNSTDDVVYIAFNEPGIYTVTLTITDGGNNTAGSTKRINVTDITPPSGRIDGPDAPILGEVSEFRANVTDNDPSFPEGGSMSWELGYRDGPEEGQWTRYYNGTDHFSFEFTTGGIYFLTLTVSDAAGNQDDIGLAISAIGDITPPHVMEIFPAVNGSFQFPEDQFFTVKFSEPMDPSTVNNISIHLDLDGDKVGFGIELKDGGTRAVLTPSAKLLFERTYTFIIEPTIADTWHNVIGVRHMQNYTVRTMFALEFPSGVFPPSVDANFSKDDNITLQFTNPVTTTGIHVELRTKTKGDIVNVPFYIHEGPNSTTVLVDGEFDPGVEYEVTVFKDSVDLFGYELDKNYIWNIKTYIPPPPPDIPPDDGKEENYWWVYAIIAVVTILLLLIVAIAIVLRIRHQAKLKRLWMEGGEGGRGEEKRREEEDALRRRVSAGTMDEPSTEVPDIDADLMAGSAPPTPATSSSFLDYSTAPSVPDEGRRADEDESWEE